MKLKYSQLPTITEKLEMNSSINQFHIANLHSTLPLASPRWQDSKQM